VRGAHGVSALTKVAIIGAGLVGRAWAMAFARGGCAVTLFDPANGIAQAALPLIAETCDAMARLDLLQGQPAADVVKRIEPVETLAQAVADADYIQENSPERADVKQAVFAELGELARPDAVIASSTSAILPSVFTAGVRHRERCVVVHPLNPPHLIQAVEVVPAPWTSAETLERARNLMLAIGQKPIMMTREIDGFLMNRLQGAVLEECFRLVEQGIVSPADIDTGIRDGLALRWSFMGPFETSDLNAPGGIADYASRYEAGFIRQFETQKTRVSWSGATLAKVEAYRRAHVPLAKITQRQHWRDQRLMALAAHKRKAAKDIGE
jgi:3-hydroxyacyl-CoA dehydrogenase